MEFQLRPANFLEVFPIWRDQLWPGRKSPIRAISPITHHLRFEEGLKTALARFWVATTKDGEIAGVISGFPTEKTLYRSRGLFVLPAFRGQGVAHQLLSAVCDDARVQGCQIVWTLPRQAAWRVYESFGFYRVSDWSSEGMEFGPNCVAFCSLAGSPPS